MSLENQVASLTAATTNLLEAVNVSKATLDQRVTDAAAQATASTQQATAAAASAAAANTSAGQSAGSASQALAIYGSTAAQQAAVTAAQNSASVAAGHAASASSVVQQDLSGVNAAALHRSPNAITAMFIYDTSKDSDGGAWTEKCQHTSWYNEPINGKWLGAQDSELQARYVNAAVGPELLVATDFSTAVGWSTVGNASVAGGEGVFTAAVTGNALTQAANLTIGKVYRVTFTIKTISSGSVRANAGNTGNGIARTSPGTYTEYITCAGNGIASFVAINTTTATIDDVSFREATPSFATTGDYFQRTSDGLFYSLNATSGITQTFRGNKRDFPRLAAIVAETGSVTIYDLTEPGRPMWMRFVGTNSYGGALMRVTTDSAGNGVACLNGTICVTSARNDGGLVVVSLPNDSAKYLTQTTLGARRAKFDYISRRNTQGLWQDGATDLPSIVSFYTNAVAMTVLPNAPIDPVTGLRVPTIAVGTAAGISVIKHDGSVVNSATTVGIGQLHIAGRLLFANRNASASNLMVFSELGGLSANFSPQGFLSASSGAPRQDDSTFRMTGASGPCVVLGRTNQDIVNMVRANPTNIAGSLIVRAASTFNTGYLFGDIRRAYLADVGAGSVGPVSELVTNSGGPFVNADGWVGVDCSVSVEGGRLKISDLTSTTAYARRALSTQAAGETLRIVYNGSISSGTGLRVGLGPGAYNNPQDNITSSASSARNVIATLGVTANNIDIIVIGTVGQTTAFIDDISIQKVVADRSYKARGANITGTLTKTPVAEGAQLVAWSNWSAVNNVQEPYSADLDFGTGEWTCSAWVNVPVVLPDASFPAVGASVVTGLNATGTNGTNTVTLFADGFEINQNDSGSVATGNILIPAVVGKSYELTADITVHSGAFKLQNSSWEGGVSIPVPAGAGVKIKVTCTGSSTALAIYRTSAAETLQRISVRNVVVRELGPALAFDRSAVGGAFWRGGVERSGRLISTVSDGTTTRTVTTTQAYNTGTWLKARANYRAGRLSIQVNGQEVAVTNGAPLLTLNNSNAVLTLGNSFALDAPFPGSIALVKFSAGVPTADQALFMYEQEKQMFRAGAQVCLPDAGSLVDLAYDDATDKWIAVSATNESEFSGLVRTSVTPSPAGSYTKATATSGVQLLARSTTNPGVDVTIPAQGLRSQLVKRAEAAAKMKQDTLVFDFDTIGFTAAMTTGSNQITASAITGTPFVGMVVTGTGIPANTTIAGINGTTYTLSANATATGSNAVGQAGFDLPTGYTARVVYSAGQQRREGSTRDYTRLFDGFREQIRFAVTPGASTWVQIHAVKEIA